MDLGSPSQSGDSLRSQNTEEHWAFERSAPAASQGWKLYVAAKPMNFARILSIVSPIFDAVNVPFKSVADVGRLKKQNAGLLGFSQIGKNIVAYLSEGEYAEELVLRLKKALELYRWKCPVVPFAREIGAGYPIYYRYGSYQSDSITIGGGARKDDRSAKAAAVPEGVTDVFQSLVENGIVDSDRQQFMYEFPATRVLRRGGKGTVYLALDLSQPVLTEVVVKTGTLNGQAPSEISDGFKLLRHEKAVWTNFERLGLGESLPDVIRYQEFRLSNALVLAKAPGGDLLQKRLDGHLTAGAIDQCLRIIRRVHSVGFCLADCKLENFVEDENGRVKLIDLEGVRPAKRGVGRHLSFVLVNPGVTDPLAHDLCHFCASVLIAPTAGNATPRGRKTDLGALLEVSTDVGSAEERARTVLKAQVGELFRAGK